MRKRKIGPQIVVCTRCREPLSPEQLRLRHQKHAYCTKCARVLVLVIDLELDPQKMGGHQYRGPA